jgi:very-short-patch-repair endonuclease
MIHEDETDTKLYLNRSRSNDTSTKGFRHITEIAYDDLTYKVLQHFEAVGRRDFFINRVMEHGDNILQSPIERAVFAFLLVSDFGVGIKGDEIHVVLPGDHLPEMLYETRSVAICPQHQVAGYFLDFGIFINTGEFCLAFDFECDGIEFHGTKNSQIAHDLKRDVILSGKGFQIYRCSGASINRHPLYEVEKFRSEIGTQISRLKNAA